jgi:hypothetical protein
VELLYGTQGTRKGKESDRKSAILKYTTFVQVEDIRYVLKAVEYGAWEVKEN